MDKNTTIEQNKASMDVYRVIFEQVEGDGLTYVDFYDRREMERFFISCICTDCVHVGYEELSVMR